MDSKLVKQIQRDAQRDLVFDPLETTRDVITRLKSFWSVQEASIREGHLSGMPGHVIIRAQSSLTDLFIEHLFDNTKRAYEKEYGAWPYPIAIIGLGGYGRKELSPFSNLDLMFLYPHKLNQNVLKPFLEKMLEFVIYPLWDLKLKVSHSCRTINQCIEEAKDDFRTRNAQLDARLICGSPKFFKFFKRTLSDFYENEPQRPFVDACVSEWRLRHKRHENTVFIQEPDIKNSVGGLRDILALLWITRAKLDLVTIEDLHQAQFLNRQESSQLQLAYDFLLRTRNELHFLTERPSNLLHLEKQPLVAQNLGYEQEDVFTRVEMFMKDYYKHAQNIYKITQQVLARIEEQDIPIHSKFSLSNVLKNYRSKPQKCVDGFIMRDNQFTYEHEDVFIENPVRLIRVFRHCQQFNAEPDTKLKNLIRESLDLITPQIIQNPSVNKSFRSILQPVGEVYPTLALMHELGVLGRFMPEFDKLTCLVQHEFYHRYTADIHTLNTIHELDKIFANKSPGKSPYLEAIRQTTRPSLLYLILLLHDIGKAKNIQDYARISVEIAGPILERLGINPKQQELILFTIKNHLEMARFWHRFDIDEPEVIAKFGSFLGDIELLRYLYVHTYCDVQGTAPDLWNSYKEMLHAKLYKKTDEYFGHRTNLLEERKQRKKLIYKDLVKIRHPELTEEKIETLLDLHPERYFVLSTPEEMELHLEMLDQLQELISKSDCSGSLMPIIHWENDIDQSLTIVTIVTWDRSGLFYNLAGAFAASGLSILSTKAITRADKITIDTFYVVEAPSALHQGKDLQKLFKKQAEDILIKDKDPMPEIVAQAKRQLKRIPLTDPSKMRFSDIRTCINVYHELSLKRTIVEIQSPDKIGLLYQIARAISTHGFDITFARITTEHGVAMDTFHIQKNNSDETTGTSDLIALREYLNDVLSEKPKSIVY